MSAPASQIRDIRSHFPLLERRLDGHAITYLDSAATTLKPYAVLEAELEYSKKFTANVHRGKHALSEEASAAFECARRKIASALHVSPTCVVFVRNATEAINVVARGLRLSSHDKVLIPVTEHHSNIVPWMREATVAWVDVDPREPITVDLISSHLKKTNPTVLAMAYGSNVSGVIHPIADICRAAREYGVITCIDASQGAPHFPLRVDELGCDFVTFSGHKMLASTGIGILSGAEQALDSLDPLLLGGGCIDRVTVSGFTLKELPHRLEAGTPNVAGALGLAAAVKFLEDIGWQVIAEHEARLGDALEIAFRSCPGLTLLMSQSKPRLAVGSAMIPKGSVTADDLAISLSNSHGIMVRSGLHCAHPLFDALGNSEGSLRASAYIYNTIEEINEFGSALRSILQFYRAR